MAAILPVAPDAPARVALQQPLTSDERDLYRLQRRALLAQRREMVARLGPLLAQARVQGLVVDNDFETMLQEAIAAIRAAGVAALDLLGLRGIADGIANHATVGLRRSVARSVGGGRGKRDRWMTLVDVAAREGRTAELDRWARDNADRITGLLNIQADTIGTTVREMVTKGERVETIAKRLAREYGISDGRARTIARTETSTLNGQIQQRSMLRSGITEAIWRNSNDSRVRGNPSGKYPVERGRTENHWKLEGVRFALNSAGPIVDPVKGIRALPGHRPNCRCTAEPVVPDVDEEELDRQIASMLGT